MSGNLDGFLDRGSEAAADARPEPAAPPPPPPEQQPAEPAPQGDPPEQEEGDDGEQASGPFAALKAEREKRRDWKEKAVRAETERDELRRQLEEAKRLASAPPPQQYQMPPPIDPVEDPQGFMQRLAEVRARDEVNNRLNTSEMLLRRDIGADAVQALQEEFRSMAREDPGLIGKLHSQPDPYAWLKTEVEAQRVLREVRTDPSAYEAKLRAKWEAERAEAAGDVPQQQPGAYASRPSLANARSAAPRSAPVFSGPTPMGDILRRG